MTWYEPWTWGDTPSNSGGSDTGGGILSSIEGGISSVASGAGSVAGSTIASVIKPLFPYLLIGIVVYIVAVKGADKILKVG